MQKEIIRYYEEGLGSTDATNQEYSKKQILLPYNQKLRQLASPRLEDAIKIV